MKESLSSLFEAACRDKSDDILFEDEQEFCSGNQALHTVQILADGLQSLGIETGARVAYLCDNSVRHVLSYFACLKSGVIPCALHVRSSAENIARALNWLDTEVLLVDSQYLQLGREALSLSGKEITVILLNKNEREADYLSYSDLCQTGSGTVQPQTISCHAPAMIILSSGTTGEPKGIVHSQTTLYQSAMAGEKVFGKMNSDDRVIVAMAPSFAAWNHVTLAFLGRAVRIVFNKTFDANHYIETIRSKQISHAALVPTAWRRVLQTLKSSEDLPALRCVFFSGESGSAEFIALVKKYYRRWIFVRPI